MKSALKLKNALNSYLLLHPNGDESVSFFQQEALLGTKNVLDGNLEKPLTDEKNFAFYYHMFTSTGKTRLAIKLMELMVDRTGAPPKTIIAVPKREDVERIFDEIQKFAPHFIPYVGKFYTREKNSAAQIIITTNTSFERGTTNGIFDPKVTELLVLDEVHESITDLRLKATNAHRNAVKIGLSATPDFSANRKVSNHFQCAYNLPHEEAFKRKAVAPHRSVILKTSANLDEVPLDEFKDYDAVALEKKLNTLARHKQALDHYATYVSPETGIPFLGQQALFNCLGVKDAQDMAKHGNQLNQKLMPEGIQFCAAVWGAMPPHEYKDIMDRYKAGKIITLAQVDLLTSSFNHPPLAIAYNMAPSKSARVVGQRGGRIGRLDPNNPNKIGYVVEMVDEATDPSKYPLLYAEYLKGARFGDVGHIKTAFKKSSSIKDSSEVESELIDVASAIMDLIKVRFEEIAEMNRGKIIDDKVFPTIRAHMNRLGIENTYDLFKKCEKSIKDAKEITGDKRNSTKDRFYRIITGTTSAWDLRSGELSAEADVLSTLFETGITELFGEAPQAKGFAMSGDYPHNKEFAKRFTKLMKQAGFSSIGKLRQSLWLKDSKDTVIEHTKTIWNHIDADPNAPQEIKPIPKRKIVDASSLSALATGQLSPLAQGQWTDLAQEVACVLNVSPEDLFQINIFETTFSKNQHLDHIDEGDGWEYDLDTLTWTRSNNDGEDIANPQIILKCLGNKFSANANSKPQCPSDNFKTVANLPDEPPKSWEELYDLKSLREIFENITGNFPKYYLGQEHIRNFAIIRALFELDFRASTLGIANNTSVTSSPSLEEIGIVFGLSKERIRQIERKFLRSLTSTLEIDQLRMHL